MAATGLETAEDPWMLSVLAINPERLAVHAYKKTT
jgi:hypothetical protein